LEPNRKTFEKVVRDHKRFGTFKVGLFNDIINTAIGVREEGLKNRPNRLNASVKEIQQF